MQRAMPRRTVFASNDCRATNKRYPQIATETVSPKPNFHLGIMEIFPKLTVVGIIIKILARKS